MSPWVSRVPRNFNLCLRGFLQSSPAFLVNLFPAFQHHGKWSPSAATPVWADRRRLRDSVTALWLVVMLVQAGVDALVEVVLKVA